MEKAIPSTMKLTWNYGKTIFEFSFQISRFFTWNNADMKILDFEFFVLSEPKAV